MATFRQIVYTVLDEIKSVNGDSYITEEHVMFLANQYRLFLIQQKIDREGADKLSLSMQQTICLDLELTDLIPEAPCTGDLLLKSILEVPTIMRGTTPSVYPYNFGVHMAYITPERMKYVGYNKYLLNIIYCCIQDLHLYLKSSNPLFLYMEKVKLTGVFEDSELAANLSCDLADEECKDILDREFPIAGDMVPLMIGLIVKELLAALYRPSDDINNSKDDIADLVAYVRKNMKSDLAKQITE